MAGDAIRITREELYDQVWSDPMVTLAQEYGLSDVGLRKKCKKLNIPVPPQGYFSRDERRKEDRTPLPPFSGNDVVEIVSTKSMFPPVFADPEQLKEAETKIAFENLPENRIIVSESLVSPHPLIEKTRTAKNLSGGPRGGRDKSRVGECLDVYVSKEHLGRAWRIMDALLKALDSRGFEVALSRRHYGNNEPITTVTVLGVVHEFGLEEIFTRVKYVPPQTNNKKKESTWTYHPPYDFLPSGRFTLSIGSYVAGSQRSWNDGKKHRIEDCLNEFIIGLIRASVFMRAKDLKWKHMEDEQLESARRKAEEEQRREEEKTRVQNLISEAQAWKQSQLIREYVDVVQAKAIEKNGEIQPGSKLDDWIAWAGQLADRLDPLMREEKKEPTGNQ